ncbi:MAG TPA: hypothetical protein VGT02_17875 [Methylomirabilota bacterium]|nr:hypothetical protein [Methylomirabilota bacterium]
MTRALFVLCLLVPGVAHAQAGWYVTPAVSVAEEFDDNVFSSASNRKWDLISRFSPSLKAGYQSKPFTLLGSAGIDAEYFAQRPELSGEANRKRLGLTLQYVPELTTTFDLAASVIQTETPTDLQVLTGIERPRGTTTQWTVAPSAIHKFTPITSGDVGYSFSEDVSDALTLRSQQGRLGLSHQFSHLGTGVAHYTLREVDSDAAPASMSHALTAGWTWRFSPTTVLSVEAGPRLSDGVIQPDVTAALSHRFHQTGELSLNYARTETVLTGNAGKVEVNSLSAALSLTPQRSLGVTLGGLVGYTTAKDLPDTLVYRANATVSYRLTKWLTFDVSHRFSIEDRGPDRIYHNIFSIGLSAVYPVRAY